MAEVAAADDETGDGSGCASDDDLSGSQLRCAQLRPLGIPMGLQGHRQRYTVRDSKRCCSLIMNCGDCYATDNCRRKVQMRAAPNRSISKVHLRDAAKSFMSDVKMRAAHEGNDGEVELSAATMACLMHMRDETERCARDTQIASAT